MYNNKINFWSLQTPEEKVFGYKAKYCSLLKKYFFAKKYFQVKEELTSKVKKSIKDSNWKYGYDILFDADINKKMKNFVFGKEKETVKEEMLKLLSYDCFVKVDRNHDRGNFPVAIFCDGILYLKVMYANDGLLYVDFHVSDDQW